MKNNNKYIEYKRSQKEQIDIILQNELNDKDLKTLMNLVRGNDVGTVLGLIEIKKLMLDTKENTYPSSWKNTIKTFPIIFDIYRKVGLEEKDWYIHWEVTRYDQKQLHINATTNTKTPRQDNKNNINYGSGNSHSNKIRYPKKNRKTAWKRFYKLFPHLKIKN